jgi:hypothetical protein
MAHIHLTTHSPLDSSIPTTIYQVAKTLPWFSMNVQRIQVNLTIRKDIMAKTQRNDLVPTRLELLFREEKAGVKETLCFLRRRIYGLNKINKVPLPAIHV